MCSILVDFLCHTLIVLTLIILCLEKNEVDEENEEARYEDRELSAQEARLAKLDARVEELSQQVENNYQVMQACLEDNINAMSMNMKKGF